MSTVGKVCLCLTVLLLLVALAPIPGEYGGWAPKLLVFHNGWSQKIRDAKIATQKAQSDRNLAIQELRKASTDLDNLMIGWDRYWTVPARGPEVPADAPALTVRNGQLLLQNLGSGSNPPLVTRQVTDESGAQQIMSPVIHAFYSAGEGFNYAGEFIATDITNSSTVLQPVHDLSREAANWPANAMWRLRGIIPAAGRSTFDELFRHKLRTAELTRHTLSNIDRQTKLLDAAQAALETRKKELLGNPDRDPVAARPEFVDGLVVATEDVEEERNQLLLDIDSLRRSIRDAASERSAKLERLNEVASMLPSPNANGPQLSSRSAVTK